MFDKPPFSRLKATVPLKGAPQYIVARHKAKSNFNPEARKKLKALSNLLPKSMPAVAHRAVFGKGKIYKK